MVLLMCKYLRRCLLNICGLSLKTGFIMESWVVRYQHVAATDASCGQGSITSTWEWVLIICTQVNLCRGWSWIVFSAFLDIRTQRWFKKVFSSVSCCFGACASFNRAANIQSQHNHANIVSGCVYIRNVANHYFQILHQRPLSVRIRCYKALECARLIWIRNSFIRGN